MNRYEKRFLRENVRGTMRRVLLEDTWGRRARPAKAPGETPGGGPRRRRLLERHLWGGSLYATFGNMNVVHVETLGEVGREEGEVGCLFLCGGAFGRGVKGGDLGSGI